MDILAILEIRFGTVQTSDLPEDVNAACGADLPVLQWPHEGALVPAPKC
ncbi:hypothetical protein QTP70_020266 [Hemibagrus guttatus]|uniref:Uncharacterized protein n=1 Tax=Hemibagrus guttatus TaxID=175788 RepID=A0AAE0PWR8_9TELE|nr:hypothetical protein QTP70_020266 [Hemibagrus guttatus]